MQALIQDVRYGVRMLFKNPAFTVIAILTLALGIGANSALFSVVNAVLLRPLPFNNPSRLVAIRSEEKDLKAQNGPSSYPDFADWRKQSSSFEGLAAWDPADFTLTGQQEPVHLFGIISSWNLIEILGVRPELGRTFTQAEDEIGTSGFVAILSHDLWQRHFSGDRNIVGHTITMDGRPYTVVGVMPPKFHFPTTNEQIDLYTTMAVKKVAEPGQQPTTELRGMNWLRVVGRLKPGVSLAQAQTELNVIEERINKQFSESRPKSIKITTEKERIVGRVESTLIVLFGAVGFVLLIACANVANLLLARATTRQKEMAIRSALGASRATIVRQLLTESVLLSLAGGASGLIVAFWSDGALSSITGHFVPRAGEIHVDITVLGFTALIALASGTVFGLVPALHMSRAGITQPLNESGRSGTESANQGLVRGALIVSEVALALILLIGSGLLLQTLWRLQKVDPGFNKEHLVTFELTLPNAKYKDPDIPRFYRNLLERIRAVPGVQSASAGFGLPMTDNAIRVSLQIMERPLPEAQRPNADAHVVAMDYFKTMEVPLIKGRDFNENDKGKSTRVVVVNQTFAKKFYPNEDPIGKQIQTGLGFGGPHSSKVVLQIIGVVADVKQQGLGEDTEPAIYYPTSQGPINDVNVVVRTSVATDALVPALRQQVWSLDKDLPLLDVHTMSAYVDESIAPQRLNGLLLGVFAALAFVLTAIGLYGVISYSVAQRTREMGIRMALGAQRGSILKMVIRQGMTLAIIGVVTGLCGAFALTRVISSMLFGVRATDSLTFICVSLMLLGIAVIASYIPALRATRIDPVIALRYE